MPGGAWDLPRYFATFWNLWLQHSGLLLCLLLILNLSRILQELWDFSIIWEGIYQTSHYTTIVLQSTCYQTYWLHSYFSFLLCVNPWKNQTGTLLGFLCGGLRSATSFFCYFLVNIVLSHNYSNTVSLSSSQSCMLEEGCMKTCSLFSSKKQFFCL